MSSLIWSLGFSAPHTLLLTPFLNMIFFLHYKNGAFVAARAEPPASIPTEGAFANAAHPMFSMPPLDRIFFREKNTSEHSLARLGWERHFHAVIKGIFTKICIQIHVM